MWLTAFLDHPRAVAAAAESFWAAATATTPSPDRGEDAEFATLLPGDGDAHLRVQRLAAGPAGVHLDLHDAEPRALADRAVTLGATEVADLGHVVLRSPGGLAHCAVPAGETRRSAPVAVDGGPASLVDQVCLDVPPRLLDAELAYWCRLLEREPVTSSASTFLPLARHDDEPLRLMLQRLDADEPAVRAHLDLACDDRPAEVARLVALGAREVGGGPRWTTLVDPAGRAFCVTDRDPRTGRRPT
ncbi:VOC family protein [Nocardioides sp. TRM66260-LWL]|uniref:VOC family protein n=1 Tax=Nocardioides sp. TRM66260-LWL TaxID=2874478 RepID=UPI001CC6BC87|nr:VOC family protein [Nocardioides sp. TRM66260-LWL]MBZ5736107.1 VOC family protein [Nocardioides sp. TRM66260-LWL]